DVEGSRNRSGSRTPMQWDESQNAGFSVAAKDKMYIPLDSDPDRPNVAKQEKDENSLLNFVRTLLRLRQTSAAMGNVGEWTLLNQVDQSYPMVYSRFSQGEKYIVAINPMDKQGTADISAVHATKVTYTFGTSKKSSYKSGKTMDVITIPAASAAIFKIE
ncbi:MAG: hypothetical protein ABIN24_00200, partial [Dyadobacter sp.]